MCSASCSKGVWTVAWLMTLLCAVSACGGSQWGGSLGDRASAPAGASAKTAGLIPAVPENEIGALSTRQRELLSDAGWNQPYIAPQTGTATSAPALSSLLAQTQAAMAKGQTLHPRYLQRAGKGASWYGDSDGPFTVPIEVGEYENLSADAAPPFGCNNDPGNVSTAGHAIEDLIATPAGSGAALPAYCLSYAREGLCATNYFNTLAGANKNASAAVYQAYCSINNGGFDPRNPPVTAQVAELSYRSSLVPDGAPGGTCAATAYAVRDYFWRAFNGVLEAVPNAPVDMYNVLIAPSGEASAEAESTGYTTGQYQPFYFGSMSACYGGAWIIGLTGSSSNCATFNNFFNTPDIGYWYRPVYGVLLQRWQELALVSAQPWTGELGWPVFGPIPYENGALQLNARGTYYQWGMWFEKGYIWWVDYDQSVNPTVPDEAHAYRFTGSNVYCFSSEDNLEKIGPTTYYGGSGPLGVNVEATAVFDEQNGAWKPVPQNDSGTEYHVALPLEDGLCTVNVRLHASGYGGTPNADCKYKTYVWAFRDGTIQPAGADYDPAQQTAEHVYGDPSVNRESTYVVRVQVQDEVGFGYGDSLPIILGHNVAMPDGGILLIRDDAPDYNTYNTNFDALCSDLDEIGALYTIVNFTPTIAADFAASGMNVAIWYRGGPGVVTEPDYTRDWTEEEEAQFNLMLKQKMLLISQAHSAMDLAGNGWTGSANYWGWDGELDSQLCQHLDFSPMTHATDQNMGLTSNEINGLYSWHSIMLSSDMGKGKDDSRGPQYLGFQGSSNNAAELYLSTGSSEKKPKKLQWATGGTDVLQFCCRGWYPPFGASWVNPGWLNGMQSNPSSGGAWDDAGTNEYTLLSYGNSTSGGASWQAPGAGKFWCWGMPYAKLSVTESTPAGMTRAEVLRNVLAWLDSDLRFKNIGDKDNWELYSGAPEIVSVRPGYWDSSSAAFTYGDESVTGVDYPDPTSTDVYRTGYFNHPGERFITTATQGNEGLNFGDIDFQFPWYAYITTTDGIVETSPAATVVPPALHTNDTLVVKGLLVSDSNVTWSRYKPADGMLPNCQLNLNIPAAGIAGYFISQAGDDGDESYAKYGVNTPALTWDNQSKLEVEAIAHWPEGLMYGAFPAKLYWSMYPGHRMFLPGTGTLISASADGWYSFRKLFDIDPSASPAGRTGSSWNAANFSYTSAVGAGRVVAFEYNKIAAWNPDLNLDQDSNLAGDGPADKFPIRCRLFTNYAQYSDSSSTTPGYQPYVWPNHEPPPASYIEGGCYVVDAGQAVFPFRILDDPAMPDPADTVTGSNGNYQIIFSFILQSGVPSYSVQFELDPTPDMSFGDAGSYVYQLGLPFSFAAPGAQSITFALNGAITPPPAGSYWVALRGLDNDVPVMSSTYFYTAKPLVLAP
jgi:hypothetical protein